MSKKSSASGSYRADISASGIRRVDGIVRSVTDAGVSIDMRERGRRTTKPTMIPMQDIVCYTTEGPGYVVYRGSYVLEPIAGEIISEDSAGVVLKDVDGTEITFPSNGVPGAVALVSVGEEDRSLKRGSVETKIQRLAEREDGSGKKRKVAEKKGKSSSKSVKVKTGKRRKI